MPKAKVEQFTGGNPIETIKPLLEDPRVMQETLIDLNKALRASYGGREGGSWILSRGKGKAAQYVGPF